MAKKKVPYMQRKQKDEINKKALIWIGSVLAAVIIIVSLLLILNV